MTRPDGPYLVVPMSDGVFLVADDDGIAVEGLAAIAVRAEAEKLAALLNDAFAWGMRVASVHRDQKARWEPPAPRN